MERHLKRSYTIPCSSAFRDAVEALAQRRRVNVGDLARSVLLLLPAEVVEAFPDPGDPPEGDRESVRLKSGPAEGRLWRRKPRLQLRMPEGYPPVAVRRALALALALEGDGVALTVARPAPPPAPPPERRDRRDDELAELRDQVERLQGMVGALAFEPLPHGVRTRDDALHVLGFPPGSAPDARTVAARFRMLATIHHPDGAHGSHARMSQLNQAMALLRRAAA